MPRLPNGWLSHQSRQPSLYVILFQDNNRGDLDLLPTGEIIPRHQNRSNVYLRYIRFKVNGTLSLGFRYSQLMEMITVLGNVTMTG